MSDKLNLFATVVFMQDDDADEILDMITEYGCLTASYPLSDYDYGEYDSVYDHAPWGKSDNIYLTDCGYIISYNHGLGYVGLHYAIVQDEVRNIIPKSTNRDNIIQGLLSSFLWGDYQTYLPIADRLEELGYISESERIRQYAIKIKDALYPNRFAEYHHRPIYREINRNG